MKSSNFLKDILNWFHEVIDSAETPMMKLAIILLPLVTPFVPAIIVGVRMYGIYLAQLEPFIEFLNVDTISKFAIFASFTTAIALELLGWAGAIGLVRNIYRLARNFSKDGYWLPVILSGTAYIFYIMDVYFVNETLQSGGDGAKIFGLLVLQSIPAGMLYADSMSNKLQREEDEKLRQEKREDKFKEKALKNGYNPFGNTAKVAKQKKGKSASYFKDKMLVYLDDIWASEHRVAKGIEIAEKFNLDYHSSKGFISGLRMNWKRKNGINTQD